MQFVNGCLGRAACLGRHLFLQSVIPTHHQGLEAACAMCPWNVEVGKKQWNPGLTCRNLQGGIQEKRRGGGEVHHARRGSRFVTNGPCHAAVSSKNQTTSMLNQWFVWWLTADRPTSSSTCRSHSSLRTCLATLHKARVSICCIARRPIVLRADITGCEHA